MLKQVTGVEPVSSAWEADVLTVVLHLHLNYYDIEIKIRIDIMRIAGGGLEPPPFQLMRLATSPIGRSRDISVIDDFGLIWIFIRYKPFGFWLRTVRLNMQYV